MKLTYKLAAAVFCMAAGMSAAAALPGTTGLIAGMVLIFLSTLVLASGAAQGAQCFREMRREEQEQLLQKLAEMQEAAKQLDADLNRYRKEAQTAHAQTGEAQCRLMDKLEQLAETVDTLEKTASSGAAYAERQGEEQKEQLAQLEEAVAAAAEQLSTDQKNGLKDVRNGIDGLKDKVQDVLDDLNENMEKLSDTLQEQSGEQKEQLMQLEEAVAAAAEQLSTDQKNGLKDVRNGIDGLKDKVQDVLDDLNENMEKLPDTLQDQSDSQMEELEKLLEDVVGTGLKEMETQVDGLRRDQVEQLRQTAAAVETFRAAASALGDDLESFHAKTETTLDDANKAAQAQLQALQTFLKKENESNRSSTEHIMQTYAALTEQDLRLLSSLGIKDGK